MSYVVGLRSHWCCISPMNLLLCKPNKSIVLSLFLFRSPLSTRLSETWASILNNNKLYLLNCLMNLRYKGNSSISNHLNEFQGLLNQLLVMSINFDDEVFGLWLLNTLSESWEIFQVSITNSAPNDIVSF